MVEEREIPRIACAVESYLFVFAVAPGSPPDTGDDPRGKDKFDQNQHRHTALPIRAMAGGATSDKSANTSIISHPLGCPGHDKHQEMLATPVS